MKTITINKLTMNTAALADLVSRLGPDSSSVSYAIEELEKNNPIGIDYTDSYLIAQEMIDYQQGYMEDLIRDCKEAGIDIDTEQSVFKDIVEVGDAIMDQEGLAENMRKASENGYPEEVRNRWDAYLETLDVDFDALAKWVIESRDTDGLEKIF